MTIELPEYVISCDPGLKSGVAVLHVVDNTPTTAHSDEIDWYQFPAFFDQAQQYVGASTTPLVVCEKFTINAKTAKNTQAPWSLENTGSYRLLAWQRFGVTELVMQMPDAAKRLMTNDRLRAVGCWHVGGAGHANDAIRHGLLALHNRGWRDTRLLKQ